MTPDQKRDKEVTDAIVEVIGVAKNALKLFGYLCEAGADYLEAKNRSRFFDGRFPMKSPGAQKMSKQKGTVKQMPPKS